jgi:putative ABC transport system ATP-binding protein/lipoprotein-releasing system ATP-binding protein
MSERATIESETRTAIARGRDLTKVLGVGSAATTVFEHTDFDIFQGDRISLTGPSGSGKSALLHLIAGLTEPTTGAVDWPGMGSPDQLRPRFITIAFQGPSLLAALSVVENVSLPLLLLEYSEDDARTSALQILDRFGLAEIADKLPEELSGGQSQRVGVARSLVGKPRLVVADEPTGQCDQATAHQVLDIIDELTVELGCGLLMASHDRSIVSRMAIHWTLESGRLKRDQA